MQTLGLTASPGAKLEASRVAELVARACPQADHRGQRILLIIPDGTRTAPVGLMFQTLFGELGGVSRAFDLLVASGRISR